MSKRSNGEGTITKRKDGRWTGAVSLSDGRRKWLYGKTQAEVARKLAEVRREQDRGASITTNGRRTLANYLESWIEMSQPTVRPGTHANNAWYLRKHVIPTLGRVQLTKLTAEHVQRLLAQKSMAGLAPSTVRKIYSVLHNALGDAVDLDLVARNVASLAKKPRERRIEMRVWDPHQARRFLEHTTEHRLHALFTLALSTGLREGELLALRWRDVTLPATTADATTADASGTLRIQNTLHWRDGKAPEKDSKATGKDSKTGPHSIMSLEEVKTARGRRQIHLSATATASLREHRARQRHERLRMGPLWRENDLVFCNSVGGALHVSNFRREFRRLVAAADLPYIRPYDMRHTAATLLLLASVHPKVVSEMLGHSSVAFTLTVYSHVLPMIQRDAATAMDKLLG